MINNLTPKLEKEVAAAKQVRDLVLETISTKMTAAEIIVVELRFPFFAEDDGSCYINFGGVRCIRGYFENCKPQHIRLYKKLKKVLIKSNKFNVRDSYTAEYETTHKLGLGNGASGWITLR